MGANDAFSRLHDDLNWYMLCREIRVLHIATSPAERSIALEQTARMEFHAENRSPFFVVEDAHTGAEDGWNMCAERLRIIHEERRVAMAKEGYVLATLPPLHHLAEPLHTMMWQLMQCLDAQKHVPELSGLLVILAPTVLETPDEFADGVRFLAGRPELAAVRFVVLEVGQSARGTLLRDFGSLGMQSECVIDPAQHRRDHVQTLAAMANAPAGASREVRAGGAGPRDRVAPARAIDLAPKEPVPPEIADYIARELGPAAALVGETGAVLQRYIAGAALAVQEQRYSDAYQLQGRACELCWHSGLARMGCILETQLGAYSLAAGHASHAQQAFEVAAQRAEMQGFLDIAAQALTGLAAVLVLQSEFHRGAEMYARAGELAERGRMPMLAVEAYRTSGQVALRASAEDAAVAIWQRALAVVAYAGPEIAAASSAPIVARALANVLQDQGRIAAAQSLYAQADAYERPSPTDAAAPQPTTNIRSPGAGEDVRAG